MSDEPIEEIQPGIEEWARKLLDKLHVTIVSRSGTRHIAGARSSRPHAGRVSTLCGLGLLADEGPYEAVRDCAFCQAEEAEAKRKAAKTETVEQLSAG